MRPAPSTAPNPECDHDYFRPFSCKGFYLCPSCSRKRTILFAEHLTNDVLLKLPHRQFVVTMPKALRPFFRHDRRLFADLSRLIYEILREFYPWSRSSGVGSSSYWWTANS
ncbi:MAG: transposase zinc-binding domain-containing protein [Spirochaetota bacterium]